MKRCLHCSTDYESKETNCPNCNANEHKYKCDNCSTIHNSNFCPNCGFGINEIIRECPKCGYKTKERFCAKCGSDTISSSLNMSAAENLDSSKKYCQHCASPIHSDAVVCPKCGRQVKTLAEQEKQSPIIINQITVENNTTDLHIYGKRKSKWVALFLCVFFGYFGIHKFYEGRVGKGLLYMFTVGLFGFGWMVDIFILLFKRNPYYV